MTDRSIHTGRFLEYLERDGWEFVRRTNASDVVAVAAVTAADEVVLIEQERKVLGQAGERVVELPAGLVGDDGQHDVLEAARRELVEETGYDAERLRLICRGPSSAGLTDEILSLVVAEGLSKVGPGGGVDGEDIAVHLIARAQVWDWLAARHEAGVLIDLKVYAGLSVLGIAAGTS